MQEIIILILITLVPCSTTFSINPLTGDEANSRNHKEMTTAGIGWAVQIYLKDNYNITDPSSSSFDVPVDIFFGDDKDGKEIYLKVRMDIITSVLQGEKSKKAYIHCNSEQFDMAHNHIQKLRKQIKDLAETSNPDLGKIREIIGQCLYTIQAFYSTSNWIEMATNHPNTYRDFGTPGRSLMAIAGHNEYSCKDCDNSGFDKNSCKNNILIFDKLTSGYKTGEDVQPPPKTDPDITIGKCGFGGSSDTENGQRTAIGGINKDRADSKYSPHHHLHSYAAFTARVATKEFLIDPEIGIINELKEDMFANVFNLNKRYRATFGFVIDVTGSMTDDIAEVSKACIEFITNVLGTDNEPEDFVLCTFSDPKNLTEVNLTTRNGLEMISRLQSLVVTGGGDCPEYAMDGLMTCIPECREHSKLFFFTDASAKDEGRRAEVVTAMQKRHIEPHFVIRGDITNCRRKKRSLSRTINSTGADVFLQIAEETGGHVYHISTSEIVDVMKDISERLFPSSTAIIDFLSLSTSAEDNVVFPLDDTCFNFKVTIHGAETTGEVDLLFSTGSIMLDSDTKIFYESPSKVIVTVVNPSRGIYTLRRLIKNEWTVNITAQTDIDFSYNILEEDSEGYMYRLSGNPIIGRTYAILLSAYNLPENASIDGLTLTTAGVSNKILYKLTKIVSEFETTYFAMTNLTAEKEYKLTIHGQIDNGTYWKRASPYTINPVSVELMVSSVSDLYYGSIRNISIEVTNMGSQSETFVTTVSDNRGLIIGDTVYTNTLGQGVTGEVIFQLNGSTSYNTVSFEASVRKTGDVNILQQVRKTVYISPYSPPSCTIDIMKGSCSGNLSCNDARWTGKATVTYGSGISSLSGTNGLVATYNRGSPSPIEVSVSGDCCVPSSFLNVIDKNNNFARCHFVLDQVQYAPRSKPALSTTAKVTIGTIGGIIAAVLVVLIVFGFITYRSGIKPKLEKLKVDTFNINATKDLPETDDKVHKSSPFVKNYAIFSAVDKGRQGFDDV